MGTGIYRRGWRPQQKKKGIVAAIVQPQLPPPKSRILRVQTNFFRRWKLSPWMQHFERRRRLGVIATVQPQVPRPKSRILRAQTNFFRRWKLSQWIQHFERQRRHVLSGFILSKSVSGSTGSTPVLLQALLKSFSTTIGSTSSDKSLIGRIMNASVGSSSTFGGPTIVNKILSIVSAVIPTVTKFWSYVVASVITVSRATLSTANAKIATVSTTVSNNAYAFKKAMLNYSMTVNSIASFANKIPKIAFLAVSSSFSTLFKSFAATKSVTTSASATMGSYLVGIIRAAVAGSSASYKHGFVAITLACWSGSYWMLTKFVNFHPGGTIQTISSSTLSFGKLLEWLLNTFTASSSAIVKLPQIINSVSSSISRSLIKSAEPVILAISSSVGYISNKAKLAYNITSGSIGYAIKAVIIPRSSTASSSSSKSISALKVITRTVGSSLSIAMSSVLNITAVVSSSLAIAKAIKTTVSSVSGSIGLWAYIYIKSLTISVSSSISALLLKTAKIIKAASVGSSTAFARASIKFVSVCANSTVSYYVSLSVKLSVITSSILRILKSLTISAYSSSSSSSASIGKIAGIVKSVSAQSSLVMARGIFFASSLVISSHINSSITRLAKTLLLMSSSAISFYNSTVGTVKSTTASSSSYLFKFMIIAISKSSTIVGKVLRIFSPVSYAGTAGSTGSMVKSALSNASIQISSIPNAIRTGFRKVTAAASSSSAINHLQASIMITNAVSSLALAFSRGPRFFVQWFRQAASRTRIVQAKNMSEVPVLYPPIDAVVEGEVVTFDFGNLFTPPTVIASVTSITCSVVGSASKDPAASTRLLGSPAVMNAPQPPLGSGASQAAVAQKIGTMVAGVTYRIHCVVLTTDNQNLSLWVHIACAAPN